MRDASEDLPYRRLLRTAELLWKSNCVGHVKVPILIGLHPKSKAVSNAEVDQKLGTVIMLGH